ncbi:hypothetical protein [Haloplanus rubicundus]|uniref:Uncharacterized protein n=1 Tax=Haloplanus rubicundus TaxID=1547898 RepID=A0A345EBS9_9EURY|nr:hypothetical protein [Haloplanus rubicundus]AXG09651.1 hypothetical protein DU484_07115 [Haloplanus rubicundus]
MSTTENAGYLTVWDDDGSSQLEAQDADLIEYTVDFTTGFKDIDGDGAGELLSFQPPDNDKRGLQVVDTSGGEATLEWRYGPDEPLKATFADVDDGSPGALVAYTTLGEVRAVDATGSELWTTDTDLSDAEATMIDVVGDDTTDIVLWTGSDVAIVDGASQDVTEFSIDSSIRSVTDYEQERLVVETEEAVTVIDLDGTALDSKSLQRQPSDIVTGDIDNDGTIEIIIGFSNELVAYRPNLAPEEPPNPLSDFDPAIHGFGFQNWSGEGEFNPPHNHETIAEDTFNTQFEQEWLPELKQNTSLPLPASIATQIADALYETLRQGPENVYSDGHCFGMCLAAQQYFENGVPDTLPAEISAAADIPRPTGEYADIGGEIDELHRSHALNSNTAVEMKQFLSPNSSQNETAYDAEKEIEAIRSAIKQNGTALIGIGSSPSTSPDDSYLHQLVGYNVEVEGESLESADTAYIDVYDPNYEADYYTTNSQRLEIDISQPTDMPLVNNDGKGYIFRYQRFALVGPRRTDFRGAVIFTSKLWGDYLENVLENILGGYMIIWANSPVRINATAPDGTQLAHPDEPVDEIPPSEIVYLSEAPAGDYEIEVEGIGTGDYMLNIKSSIKDGGQIDKQVIREITEDETQMLTATIPENPDEEGTISEGRGSELPTDPGEPTFRDVLGVIRAYNVDGRYNGVKVSFRDVLEVISAYNAE